MPSIALFIRELLAEDKYSSDFINRIEERIQGLNAAQLQGMYNHLKKTQQSSKSTMWKAANQEIMTKIEGILKIRVEEVQKERKVIEEYYLKQQQKLQLKRVAAQEKIRVMEMIEQNSLAEAEREVKENEQKRQAAERVHILLEIAKAEDRRNFWWKVLAGFYFCALGALSYIMSNTIIILVPCAFGLTFICIYLAYRAHLWTDIKPIVISQDYLQSQIESKSELLRKQALSNIRERERKFQEQQRRDTIERRRLRAERKQKQREEIELLERQRMERIQQAKFLLANSIRGESSAGLKQARGLNISRTSQVQPVDDTTALISDSELDFPIQGYLPRKADIGQDKKLIRFDVHEPGHSEIGPSNQEHENNEDWALHEYSSSEEQFDSSVETNEKQLNQHLNPVIDDDFLSVSVSAMNLKYPIDSNIYFSAEKEDLSDSLFVKSEEIV